MIEKRQELKKTLCHYTSDTFTDMKAVREFCENLSEWMERRKTEVDRMKDINDRADKIDLTFSHVKQSEKKGKAFWNYMKSKFTQKSADRKRAELEKELAEVLKDTLEGLKKLHVFLDAVEKLAVTSLHVFTENQLLHLPEKIKLSHVQAAIKAARLICPLLLEFKRDAKEFFLPKLQNVEVLVYQLDRYMQTTEAICKEMEKSCISDFYPTMTVVDLNASLSEHEVHTMVDLINQLNEIRMDPNFRMVFLFKEKSCHEFTKEFNERQPKMLDFLKGMEDNAVKLDKMNKGAKISSVAGSSVGAIGGVLSIVGLALIPVTAGVSLGLTIAGVVLGVTSGVNNIVTTATEVGVNYTQKKKANEVFKSFMEDVESLQKYLDEVTKQPAANVEPSKIDVAVGVGKVASKLGTAGKGIDSLIDAVSALKLLRNDEIIPSAGKVVAQEGGALRNVPRVASDIPDIGQAVAKGPLALTKGARAGFIVANALFLGMDVFFICKDSISLSRGSETKVSQFLRARAALWRSEMDSWEKICNSLCQSKLTKEEKKAKLEEPFYPGKGM